MTGSQQNDERHRPQELAAHLRRLVSDIPAILEGDPQRALHRARAAAKWILQDLFRQAYSGTTDEAPEELRYGALYSLVVGADLLPRRIQVQFQAIETFGTAEDHSDSGLTRGDVLPCLHALNTIVRWYLEDHLGSRETISFLPSDITSVSSAAGRSPAPPAARRRRPPWRSVARHRSPTLWRLLAGFLSLVVAGIFLLQLREVELSAGRRIGFVLDDSRDGVRLVEFLAEWRNHRRILLEPRQHLPRQPPRAGGAADW